MHLIRQDTWKKMTWWPAFVLVLIRIPSYLTVINPIILHDCKIRIAAIYTIRPYKYCERRRRCYGLTNTSNITKGLSPQREWNVLSHQPCTFFMTDLHQRCDIRVYVQNPIAYIAYCKWCPQCWRHVQSKNTWSLGHHLVVKPPSSFGCWMCTKISEVHVVEMGKVTSLRRCLSYFFKF